MTAYGIVLLVHGWWRWAVLVLGVLTLAQLFRSWRSDAVSAPTRLHRGFLAALDAQFLLGLLLYLVLSPLSSAGWTDFGSAMGDGVLRFYTVEHAFGMLVAVAAAHVGFDRLKRAAREGTLTSSTGRFSLIAQSVWLLVILISIPWPWLPYGRPLLRPFF